MSTKEIKAQPKAEKAQAKVEKAVPKTAKAQPKVEKVLPKVEKALPKAERAQPKAEKVQPKEEKTQPKYEEDQRVRITLGRNLTNPLYRHLIRHDSQHGTIIGAGYMPEKGNKIDFPGEYLYRLRIGSNKVSDIPEQVLEADKSAAPNRPDLQ